MTRPRRPPGHTRRSGGHRAWHHDRRVVEGVVAVFGAALLGSAVVAAAGARPPTDDHTFTAGGVVGGQSAPLSAGGVIGGARLLTAGAASTAAPSERARRSTAGHPSAASSDPRQGGPTTSLSTPTATSGPAGAVLVAQRPDPPVRVRVDGVDIDQPVVPVGLQARGALALPARPDTVGWYRWGSWPARPSGSVLLAAHLDSRTYGVGPFVRLRTTAVGSTISIWSQSGLLSRYRVLDVRELARTAVAYPQLTDPTGPPRLHLLTCGGPYLLEHGGYQDTVVVDAVPD